MDREFAFKVTQVLMEAGSEAGYTRDEILESCELLVDGELEDDLEFDPDEIITDADPGDEDDSGDTQDDSFAV